MREPQQQDYYALGCEGLVALNVPTPNPKTLIQLPRGWDSWTSKGVAQKGRGFPATGFFVL